MLMAVSLRERWGGGGGQARCLVVVVSPARGVPYTLYRCYRSPVPIRALGTTAGLACIFRGVCLQRVWECRIVSLSSCASTSLVPLTVASVFLFIVVVVNCIFFLCVWKRRAVGQLWLQLYFTDKLTPFCPTFPCCIVTIDSPAKCTNHGTKVFHPARSIQIYARPSRRVSRVCCVGYCIILYLAVDVVVIVDLRWPVATRRGMGRKLCGGLRRQMARGTAGWVWKTTAPCVVA